MATPNKRRAASPRERKDNPTPSPQSTTKGVKTPGGPTAQERYGNYRLLKVLQLLMQATEKFLYQFSPFMPDECGAQARKLHGDITFNLPMIEAAVESHERAPNAVPADNRGEGGAA